MNDIKVGDTVFLKSNNTAVVICKIENEKAKAMLPGMHTIKFIDEVTYRYRELKSLDRGRGTREDFFTLEESLLMIEDNIMDNIVEAWNGFVLLEPQHPSETKDFLEAIHKLQYVMMARQARRENPEKFPIMNKEEK